MAAMLGYTTEDVVGRRLSSFMSEEGHALALRNVEHQRQGAAGERSRWDSGVPASCTSRFDDSIEPRVTSAASAPDAAVQIVAVARFQRTMDVLSSGK